MHRQTTKQRAKNKWSGIITHLLGEHATNRKHGPCPVCGGKDRYRYDNKNGDGDWYCNVCGAGDGFRLIQEALNVDFAEAARQVDRLIDGGRTWSDEPFESDPNFAERKLKLNSMWAGAHEPAHALAYLQSRGIPIEVLERLTADVRGSGRVWSTEDSAHFPAMLSLIRSQKGVPISIHRTILTGKGKTSKKIMPPMEKINGGYIKLIEPQEHLMIAEGVETALAATAVTGVPAWATISAHGMEMFSTVPKHVKHVTVVADNDHSFTGQGSAFKCAANFRNRKGIDTQVIMPPVEGMDMLDYLADCSEGKQQLLKWRGN